MKRKAAFLLIAIVIALLMSGTNGFSWTDYGSNVDALCAPARPYEGNCMLCHNVDKEESIEAQKAYSAGGSALTEYFCPEEPSVY